jgi:NAD(P)H-hydrate epimerase
LNQPDQLATFRASNDTGMPRAVSVATMQAIDTQAIERIGIPRLLLMEHAGVAVARAATAFLPSTPARVVVCCGTGFNGGDGFAAARHLEEWGYALDVLVAGRLDHLRAEPATFAAILQRLGLPILEVTGRPEAWPRVDQALERCGLIIDALLGIGTTGAVREPIASLIERLNRSGKPIIAVDLPSGLDGDTGLVQGVAVRATATVAFGLPKQGCFLQAGPAHVGSLTVDAITIPRTLLSTAAR